MGDSETANGVEFVGAFTVSVATTYVIILWLIPKLKSKGIVGKDLNKPGHPEVAEMGGLAVVMGFFGGVGALLALDGVQNLDLLNVSLSAVLGAAFVGVMDDLFNLSHWQKAFLPFVLALPFGTVANSVVAVPHVAVIDFGPYMVLVAALAITCAANAANMLEGFNGLGTGLGIIMGTTLVILSIVHNRLDGTYLLVPLLGGLIALLWFNKYPASIFPGDTMMLFMGATLAAAGMLSNLHIQTGVIFMPMIVEFFLKVKGRFRAENYSTTSENGWLKYHGHIESLTHLVMKRRRVTERMLVGYIWAMEVVICGIVLTVDILL